jgi:hypothetical protein
MPRKFVMGHSVGEVAAGLIVPLLVLNCRMSLKARSLSFSDILLRGRNRNTSRLNQMPFGSLALNLIELVLRSSGEGPTMASFGGASERASNLVLLVADGNVNLHAIANTLRNFISHEVFPADSEAAATEDSSGSCVIQSLFPPSLPCRVID